MPKLSSAFLVALLTLVPVSVFAGERARLDPSIVQGNYAFTGEGSCLIASGFDEAQGFKPQSPPALAVFSVEGVRTFNGDGTGSIAGTSVGGNSVTRFTATFKYEVGADRTINTIVDPGTFQLTFVEGRVPTVSGSEVANGSQTATIDDFPPLSGRIAQGGRSITLAENGLHVETQTFSTGVVQPRLCNRSRVLLKLDGDR